MADDDGFCDGPCDCDGRGFRFMEDDDGVFCGWYKETVGSYGLLLNGVVT